MAETAAASDKKAATFEVSDSLLDQMIDATGSVVAKDRIKDWMDDLAKEVTDGHLGWEGSVKRTIQGRISQIDVMISKQLAAVMHTKEFLKLEGTWRGLKHLVDNTITSSSLKLKVFNASKEDLTKDLAKSDDVGESEMFQKIYEEEFGSPGGEPYAAFVGDYEIENSPNDMDFLRKMSSIMASGFSPFITAPSPKLFGFKSMPQLASVKRLHEVFSGPEHIKWRSFRESEDSRFVTMAMPRALARLPYGKDTKPIDEFAYEETELDAKGHSKPVDHEHYCWMNAAYVMGARLTDAFSRTGWCTAIRGANNGGKVENLPMHLFASDDGSIDAKCPTEIGITDRFEGQLSDQGFLPLCHYKNTDYSVFFGAQTAQKPKTYSGPTAKAAEANAQLSARLPYIMAVSRIAHQLKVMGRDQIGSFKEKDDVRKFMQNWISDFVLDDPNPSEAMKAKYPLRQAQISVEEVPGKPGSYNAVAHLVPWLQMESLTTSFRLVAALPKMKS